MDKHVQLANWIAANPDRIGKVVDLVAGTDRLLQLDFTENNRELTLADLAVTERFSAWIDRKVASNNARYGIGGYFEYRTIYGRSALFDTTDEPRRLHLGVDIWSNAGTPVYVPIDGKVHSYQDNNNFGDYGPTIILEHDLDGIKLYSLYGHLSRESLSGLYEEKPVDAGEILGHFGDATENGQWPPHLHFQLMFDMEGMRGDYPGVCKYSEMEKYKLNIPDPDLILNFPKGNII
ncbi:peptidoglycan DD-metalloendopeptidase family protein [Mucilaginibacter sp. HMF5004]|uniref:peptidoglycan DD-metalloendopeptidase family protein n=1 Tax=Mucilaginibacter rivuli TaxID=2857527 RepID=UPI001C5FE571|nr:peptidoglycan DD-metalloendopeptidase family protein [Mucilaginibacter rivuli]MBW4891760.1 peptidoglycan DD-metalloendopeptidase family protein [Mucilaginibacter rivuli]